MQQKHIPGQPKANDEALEQTPSTLSKRRQLINALQVSRSRLNQSISNFSQLKFADDLNEATQDSPSCKQ